MKNTLFSLVLLLFSFQSMAQKESDKKSKLFFSAGYGLAGSFFVRSYQEFAPVSDYKTFYKKKFIGVSQTAAIGLSLKKNLEIKFGLNFQHFIRRVKLMDTLNNAYINIDHDIHHRDYVWFGSLAKKLESKNHLFAFGFGLYYLRPKQQEVEIFTNYFGDIERNFKNSRLNEAGAFTELAYEYKFQPKVNVGVKTQFYYTISAAYAESITLFPYIKILF